MIRILFCCHGNICRSPMAEQIFLSLVKKRGLEKHFQIDSAATSREEIGYPIYPPIRKTLIMHGIDPGTHRARQITKKDYEDFDLLIGMDSENRWSLRRFYNDDPLGKIHLLLDYTDNPKDVDDPWYTRDFESAFNDIKEGCERLLAYLQKENGLC